MNENTRSLQSKDIWSQLFYSGVGIGIFAGLVEVCWTYFLPTFFPNRHYELPVSTIGRFILIAIVGDVLVMTISAGLFGVLILVVRKVWQRGRSFGHWPTVIRFLLVAGAFSYLYLGFLYSYYLFPGEYKQLTAALGVLAVVLISILIVYVLAIAVRWFGRAAPAVVWVLSLVVLFCTGTPKYLHYRSENTFEMDLPAINIDQRPNILFVTLDTLRADYLGCYGNKIVQTPVLDALAADGCLFELAFAQAPRTTPSHCSIMTSTYVARNGSRNGCAMKLGFPTLAEILQANGYETSAFVSCTMVRSKNSGLQRGFDYYEDSISPYTTLLRNDEYQFLIAITLLVSLQHSQIPGHIVSNRALPWFEKHKQGPFFCWLHYFDPHTPYDAPEPYKDMYEGKVDPTPPCVFERRRYAGEVSYTDVQFGRIIKLLKDKGLYDDMLIIVTADHGEAFGEKHGDITEYGHGQYLYDTTQQVPLIIKLPNDSRGGRRIGHVVELLDMAPTVLDFLGASLPETFEGRSLLGLLNGKERNERGVAYSERLSLPDVIGAGLHDPERRRMMAMRTSDIKYICDAGGERQELYEIASDPAETVNVYSDNLELAKSAYQSIQNTLGETVETGVTELDPKVLEQLRSLGYIGEDQNGREKSKIENKRGK